MSKMERLAAGLAGAIFIFCLVALGYFIALDRYQVKADSFAGQPCLVSDEGGWVIQRLANGEWVVFEDPALRWTDSNLEKIGGRAWND
jgi:hypothetical protein